MKFGVDIRREHMVIAFINRPNGDFTFTTAAHTGNAAADFLLGLPAQFRRTTQQHRPGRRRLALRRLRAGRVPAQRRDVTLNAGAALRAADAVRRT